MRRVLRENALGVSLALLGSATVAWLSLAGFAWSDYEVETLPSYEALIHGHVAAFLRLAPAYGGSLVERAPFALLPSLWGGGSLAVFRMVAVPCLLAAAALGVFLLAQMRSDGHSRLARAVALGVCVANPLTMRALEIGHPEDLLGGCLCVAAVLLAGRERPLLAGVALGLAIANKEWALVAAGPVLLALRPGLRLRCGAMAAAAAALVLAPLAVGSLSAFATSARTASAPPSPIFEPWQLWWFLGHHEPRVYGSFGAIKLGYRVGPVWVRDVSHPLIVLVASAISLGLWARLRGRTLALREALLALALVLMGRFMLDTWDSIYYPIPFVLALLSWEVHAGERRPPVLALGCTAMIWLNMHTGSPDLQAALFAAWTLPLAGWLSLRLVSCTRAAPAGGAAAAGARVQETTVRALDSVVSVS